MTTIRSVGEATLRGGTPDRSAESVRNGTRALLACGVVAGPLFIVTALVQMLTRAGFDPVYHPMSLLSQGDLGWLQVTNFVVGGLLFMASAVGMRRALRSGRGSTWGPRLIGIMGFAMVCGGVFVADPAGGFPPGTPPGPPEQFSWHSILHSFAPPVAVWATVVACVVFTRRFRSLAHPGWAAYCTATAVATPVIAIAAFPVGDFRLLFAGVALQLLWASILAARLMIDVSKSSNPKVEPAPSAQAQDASGRRSVMYDQHRARRTDYVVVAVAAVVALVASALYYSPMLFGGVWTELSGAGPDATGNAEPPIGQSLAQLARNLVVASTLAWFIGRLTTDWKGAIRLATLIWVGLEAMATAGAVIHEDYPVALYAIHVGDALMTTLLMSSIISVWRRSGVSRRGATLARTAP